MGGDPIPNFVYYPTLGLVTGNNVRLRNNPGTEGTEIVGMVSALHLVVLGETSVEGDRWYEVEHPTAAGTAWIFGQYLQPVYEEGQQESIRARFLTNLSSTFGSITEKALLLFGKPSGERQAPIEMEGLEFQLKDGHVTEMGYQVYYNIG